MDNKKKLIIISSIVIGVLIILLIILTAILKQKNNTLQTDIENIAQSEEKTSKVSLKAKASDKTLKFTVSLGNIENGEFDIEKSYNEQFDDPTLLSGSHNNEQYEDDLTEDIEKNVEKCFYRLKIKNDNEIIYSNILKITLKNQSFDSEILDDEEKFDIDEIINVENIELNIDDYNDNYIAYNENNYTDDDLDDEEIPENIEEIEEDLQNYFETSSNEVKYISLSEENVNLDTTGYNTITLIATVTPSNAENKTITWTSSNPQIASVDKNGKITGLSNGVCVITAKTSNGQSQTCEVNVTTSPTKISLNESQVFLDMLNNRQATLKATIEPSTSIEKSLIWTSSNENVAIVDSDGNVIANSNGTAVIKCETPNSKFATCTVNVTTSGSGIYLNKTSVNLDLNETKQINLKATIIPSTTANKTITWSSSNPNIAVVDSNGGVVAKSLGNTIITAKMSNGKIATCKVVVESSVTSIKLDKANVTLNTKENNKIQLNATVYPLNATNKTVKWTSSNTNIATVDSNGLVIAKLSGNTIITAKTSNGKIATCKIVIETKVNNTNDNNNKNVVDVINGKGLYRQYDSDSGFYYWIYIPDKYAIKGSSKIPLVIFLHGNGEIGRNINVLKDNNTLVKLISKDTSFNKYGAIIIAPQSTAAWYNTSLARLKILADNVVAKYGVNKNKISITGFSGGAIGCWNFALAYPNYLSCVVPVAGYSSSYNGQGNLHKRTSLWCIVGEYDSYSRPKMESLYNAFRKYDKTARLTVVPGLGHNCYTPYTKYNVINWMIQQTKK